MASANLPNELIDPPATKHRRPAFTKRLRDSKYLLILFLPTLFYYIIFEYLPMFGLVISFKNYNLFKGIWASKWVGVKYYIIFLHNPDFIELLRNTFLLGFYSLFFGFAPPIILALLLNELQFTFFKRLVQTLSYLPHFISTVIVVSMLVMFLSPGDGLINIILTKLGLHSIYFLSKPEWFRTIYVTSGIWQGVGWGTIIYLAALTAIDSHLYEAAEMDGAGRWRKMWSISLPGIATVIFILLVLDFGSLFSVGFEKVFLLSNPLTYETADIISTYTFRTGLVQGNFSYAAAIGTFNSVIHAVLLIAANTAARRLRDISLW